MVWRCRQWLESLGGLEHEAAHPAELFELLLPSLGVGQVAVAYAVSGAQAEEAVLVLCPREGLSDRQCLFSRSRCVPWRIRLRHPSVDVVTNVGGNDVVLLREVRLVPTSSNRQPGPERSGQVLRCRLDFLACKEFCRSVKTLSRGYHVTLLRSSNGYEKPLLGFRIFLTWATPLCKENEGDETKRPLNF